MSSVPASSGAAMPPAVAGGAIDPRLQAVVQSLPADQQPAALAKLKSMTPAQQQQLIAEVTQAAAAQQAGAAGAAGPGPAQASVGATATAPPNKMATILKKVAIMGGIGAAVGFGASFLTLPVIGQVAAPIAAAVGGGIGAIAGLVLGMKEANAKQAEYDQAQAAQPTPAPAPPATGSAPPAVEPVEGSAPPVAGPAKVGTVKPGSHYTVVRGDNLSTIAARHELTWQQLYKANREAVGPNPHLIHPGLRLLIPDAA